MALAVGALLTGGVTASASAASTSTEAAKGTTLATLKIETAHVMVKSAGTAKFVDAKDGQALHQGDAIETDETGHAEIDYTDGSLTRLSTSTSYKITKLSNKRGGRQTEGTLSVGETWNRAAKVSETGSFKVKAGGTTAAVEGTAFVFSCTKKAKHKKCKVLSVVDTVQLTTSGGASTHLTPGTLALVNDDVQGTLAKLGYEDLIKLSVVVDNLNLDEKAGKGGLFEITPPPPPTTTVPPTTTTAPPVTRPPTPPPPPDVTAPQITLSAPLNGAVYARNQVVAASYSCVDESGGSGLAACNGSVPSGSAIDTSQAGAHSFTVTAFDNVGNTAFITIVYTVT